MFLDEISVTAVDGEDVAARGDGEPSGPLMAPPPTDRPPCPGARQAEDSARDGVDRAVHRVRDIERPVSAEPHPGGSDHQRGRIGLSANPEPMVVVASSLGPTVGRGRN